MKRIATIVLALMLAGAMLAPVEALARNTAREPGGVPAFFIGCCFGLREGTMWNEGADLHWREWATIIPVVGVVFAIWNGIDSANGMTSEQWAEQNAANWY